MADGLAVVHDQVIAASSTGAVGGRKSENAKGERPSNRFRCNARRFHGVRSRDGPHPKRAADVQRLYERVRQSVLCRSMLSVARHQQVFRAVISADSRRRLQVRGEWTWAGVSASSPRSTSFQVWSRTGS